MKKVNVTGKKEVVVVSDLDLKIPWLVSYCYCYKGDFLYKQYADFRTGNSGGWSPFFKGDIDILFV